MPITPEDVAIFAGHVYDEDLAVDRNGPFWASPDGKHSDACPNMQTAEECLRLLDVFMVAHNGVVRSRGAHEYDRKAEAIVTLWQIDLQIWPHVDGKRIFRGEGKTLPEAVYKAVEAYLEWKAVQDVN